MSTIISYAIIAVLAIVIVSAIVSIYNRLVMLKFNVDKAFANIDVILKQRADEIPNLIKVVKESMSYEQTLLEKLTKLRTDFLNAANADAKINLTNEITNVFKNVFAVSENYPDLKVNSSFLSLQSRVSQIEDAISDRREFFNESINMYNIGINEFPNVILAKIFLYREKPLLLITEEEKKYDGIQF
ncbi:LemA family protein [Flavobacterium sp. H122]|uniref:LemA family protein n=1 Tax=Flavobacterium sp. H122 TaxID=2529860 RepID=UPI0010AB1891|nr:LemA family protein [Flavobacterium sp. H122]